MVLEHLVGPEPAAKAEIPNPKSQVPRNLQTPIIKTVGAAYLPDCSLGILSLGIYLELPTQRVGAVGKITKL
jgi:hypothetical protein